MKRLAAVAALISVGAWQNAAFAVGTPANTPIDNRATVNYSIGAIPQTVVESSPTGNTTPGVGAGANTSFVVDDRIDLTVSEVSGGNTTVNPGQVDAVTSFRVRNTGNAPHAFALTPSNLTSGSVFGNADSGIDLNNLRARVDNGDGIYNAADDTQANILTLAPDTEVIVFVLADAPLTGISNGQFANVRLTAAAATNNAPGTLSVATPVTTADTAGSVDIVFGDGAGSGDIARDGLHSSDDQYVVQSVNLTVTKASQVIYDPLNLDIGPTNFPKAIPGARVEYTVTVANTGGTAATGVSITDQLPVTNTTFRQNAYDTNTRDVRITVNGTDTFCIAEVGTDTNSDGCFRNATGLLTVGGSAMPTIPSSGPTSTVVIRFQVVIS